MAEATATKLVGVAIPTLRELRAAVLRGSDPDSAVGSLREAGYAGGDSVYEAFEQWLEAGGEPTGAGDLLLSDFGERIGDYFRAAGWGEMTFSSDESEGIAVVDIDSCWESSSSGEEAMGCHVTTGLLAAFFGRVAGYPVSVMETECSEGGRCSFVLGNSEVMQYRWESLS
jgi:predicted hydrocarbon binding protein